MPAYHRFIANRSSFVPLVGVVGLGSCECSLKFGADVGADAVFTGDGNAEVFGLGKDDGVVCDTTLDIVDLEGVFASGKVAEVLIVASVVRPCVGEGTFVAACHMCGDFTVSGTEAGGIDGVVRDSQDSRTLDDRVHACGTVVAILYSDGVVTIVQAGPSRGSVFKVTVVELVGVGGCLSAVCLHGDAAHIAAIATGNLGDGSHFDGELFGLLDSVVGRGRAAVVVGDGHIISADGQGVDVCNRFIGAVRPCVGEAVASGYGCFDFTSAFAVAKHVSGCKGDGGNGVHLDRHSLGELATVAVHTAYIVVVHALRVGGESA